MFASLATLLVVAVASNAEVNIEKCSELFSPEILKSYCCEGMNFLEQTNECDHPMPSKGDYNQFCDVVACVYKKNGLLQSDESLDEEAVSNLLDKYAKAHPTDLATVTTVKNVCLNGQFKAYAPKFICDSLKMHFCVSINSMMECPKWKDLPECTKLKSLTKECQPLIDDMLKVLAK